MSEILIEMAELVASKVGDALEGHAINDMGELTLHVKAEKLVDIVELLKTNQQLKFSTLIDGTISSSATAAFNRTRWFVYIDRKW